MKSPLLQPDGLDRSESYEEKNMAQPGTTHDQPEGQGAVKLTKAQTDTLRELAWFGDRQCCYWARAASCARLATLGLAEQYTPPSVAERPRITTRPYRITPAGRAALSAESGS